MIGVEWSTRRRKATTTTTAERVLGLRNSFVTLSSSSPTTHSISISKMPATTHLAGPPDDPELKKPWLVQKYGGTSVGKFLEAITSEIAP